MIRLWSSQKRMAILLWRSYSSLIQREFGPKFSLKAMAPPSVTLFLVALRLDSLALVHMYISIAGPVLFKQKDTPRRRLLPTISGLVATIHIAERRSCGNTAHS